MQIDLAPWGHDLESFVGVSVEAEEAGFGRVWSSELHRSPFVPLAAVATATESIGIGTGIALAFVRSPMSLGLAALDLDELSGGRLTLGLGTGVRRLVERHHDAPFDPPVGRLEDTIGIARSFMESAHTGASIDHDGERSISLKGYERPYPPVREAIPVHVAAVGSQMLRLAGKVADGWIGHELMSPAYLEQHVLPAIGQGLASSSRGRSDIEIVVSAVCAIDADEAAARRKAAATVAFYASVRTYEPFFEFHGFGAEARVVQDRFRAGDTAGMIDAVPDAMVDSVAIAGTLDQVGEAIRRYEGLADAIKLGAPTYFQGHAAVQESVDALVRGLGATIE